MSSPATDQKMLVNTLYHGAVVTSLIISYAKFGKSIFGGKNIKIDLTASLVGMLLSDNSFALSTKYLLI